MTKTRLGGNVCDNGDGAWTEGSCQPPSAVADEDEVRERTNRPPSQEVGGGGRAGPTELPRPTIEAEEGLSSLEAAAPAFAPPLLGVAVCGFPPDNQSSAVAAEWAKEGPILAPLLRVSERLIDRAYIYMYVRERCDERACESGSESAGE
eukprot:GHVU01138021.1.p3 GENE.GHVU01138021.1~~GHVU01138021.1.p3  ORF type:complete len:150 (-),score=24.12 GHVU01138021.1:171-620(-)